jgi:hypothetical protein
MAAVESPKSKEIENRNEKEARAAWKVVVTFQNELEISGDTLGKILSKERGTIQRWKKDQKIPLSSDKFLREAVSNFIAIYRSLGAMFANKNDRKIWMETTHNDFNEAPLNVMKESFSGLIQLRKYLDYIRGRGA